jgi:hypothetical protein
MKLPKQSAPIERFAAPSAKSNLSGVEASLFRLPEDILPTKSVFFPNSPPILTTF